MLLIFENLVQGLFWLFLIAKSSSISSVVFVTAILSEYNDNIDKESS